MVLILHFPQTMRSHEPPIDLRNRCSVINQIPLSDYNLTPPTFVSDHGLERQDLFSRRQIQSMHKQCLSKKHISVRSFLSQIYRKIRAVEWLEENWLRRLELDRQVELPRLSLSNIFSVHDFLKLLIHPLYLFQISDL